MNEITMVLAGGTTIIFSFWFGYIIGRARSNQKGYKKGYKDGIHTAYQNL